MKRISLALAVAVLLPVASSARPTTAGASAAPTAPVLPLSDYLTEVSTKHLGLKSAEQNAQAAKAYSAEAATLTAPALLGNATKSSEGRSNPLAPDNHFATTTYSLGLSQATKAGISGKLLYNYFDLSLPGLPGYSTGYGQLDLSASLLRNFLGSELREQERLAETSALAKSYAQSFTGKSLLLEAESLYWRLSMARNLVSIQNEAVERAQKIADWTGRRLRLQLADKSETLQAKTNLQARRLDLRTAEDEERAASLAFNSSRGVIGDKVDESLTELTPELISRMNAPERTAKRDDVRAAEYQAEATAANALVAKERNKPTLELYGSALLTDPTAPSGSLATMIPFSARPTSSIGLRLTAPLNLGTLSRAREGYAAEARAAEWQYQRKVFEEERDWKDLAAKFRETKERYRLFTELEKIQKEKFEFERDRQQRGRSTLQQVLLFETDYQNAQLGRLRTLAELMTLNAQMKLYGVAYESR